MDCLDDNVDLTKLLLAKCRLDGTVAGYIISGASELRSVLDPT
jgi:hypothetical protein